MGERLYDQYDLMKHLTSDESFCSSDWLMFMLINIHEHGHVTSLYVKADWMDPYSHEYS